MPDHARTLAPGTAAWACASLLAFAGAMFLAANHPLWPTALSGVLVAWTLLAYRRPAAWLFVLPACLPALNLSPWTGWIGVEELDIAVLATVAAGYARLACHAGPRAAPLSRLGRGLVLAVAVVTLLGAWRGVVDAGGWGFGWYDGYTEPLNSLRVAKSAVHALLLLPLLRQAWSVDPDAAFRRFALGMLTGAAVLTLAVLWERAAFPGLLNVLSPYRSVGLFWEMHVGGAAIDAYVALCTPFVAWALWAARAKGTWLAAALFSLLWAYTCLSTFSRGAYLGIAAGLLVLGLLLPATQGRRWWPAARGLAYVLGSALLLALMLDGWGYGAAALALVALGVAFWLRWRAGAARRQRSLAAGMLILVLVFEAVVMVGPDSFMSARLARSALDYESRTVHWGQGIDRLQTAGDWLVGIGLGRLPAHYDQFTPSEFPGRARWQRDPGGGHARLDGPKSRAILAGRFGLTQRVPLAPAYLLRLDLRAAQAAGVLARVCESHLLYDRECQSAVIRLGSSEAGRWQHRELALRGPPLRPGRWFTPRQGVFTISVIDVGAMVDVDNADVSLADGSPLLANGSFANGLAHWLPAAQGFFVPWHIDNLFLELAVERGIVGALLLLALAFAAVWLPLARRDPPDSKAAFVAASVAGVLCLGLVSSVFDTPRPALLLALLVAMGNMRVQ